MNEGVLRIWRMCGKRIYEFQKYEKFERCFLVFSVSKDGTEYISPNDHKASKILCEEQRHPACSEVRKLLCEDLRQQGSSATCKTCEDC